MSDIVCIERPFGVNEHPLGDDSQRRVNFEGRKEEKKKKKGTLSIDHNWGKIGKHVVNSELPQR